MVALDRGVDHRVAVVQHHHASGTPQWFAGLAAILRPGHGRTGQVGGIHDLDGHTGPAVSLPRMAQLVHGVASGELRGAEPLHEHAAHQRAVLLHTAQHRIQRGEAARHILDVDQRRGDDAVPVQQDLDLRQRALLGGGGDGWHGRP